MRAMNDTISKFSALAFRNKRILYLSQKSDFRRYSSDIQCFWTLFYQNRVILDAILLNNFLYLKPFLKPFLAQTISLKRSSEIHAEAIKTILTLCIFSVSVCFRERSYALQLQAHVFL